MRGAGLLVSTDIAQTAGLAPALSRTAFRILQEALTNVLRHAGPGTRVHVVVRSSSGVLVLIVTDDGVLTGPLSPGSGLRGMRERVEGVGGTLSVRAAGSGCEVRAELPVDVPAQRAVKGIR